MADTAAEAPLLRNKEANEYLEEEEVYVRRRPFIPYKYGFIVGVVANATFAVLLLWIFISTRHYHHKHHQQKAQQQQAAANSKPQQPPPPHPLATVTSAVASSTNKPVPTIDGSSSNTTVTSIIVPTLAAPTNAASPSVQPFSGYDLRILPLGDSITYGYKSTDGNGYRKPLYDLLSNNTIDMIGTQHNGNMTENAHEGHIHWRIDQMLSVASLSEGDQPNVVLLHAGSNDMSQEHEPKEAPVRLGKLIDLVSSSYPLAAILVAEIIPSSGDYQQRIDRFNAAIPELVHERVDHGMHVHLVNMSRGLNIHDDLEDSFHPNDEGYAKMADLWYTGLLEIEGMGWLATGGDTISTDNSTGVVEAANASNTTEAGDAANSSETTAPFELPVPANATKATRRF